MRGKEVDMGSRRMSRRGSPASSLVNGQEVDCKCSWASGRLEWLEKPQNVLIIGKRSQEVTGKILELCEWLVNEREMRVYVEAWRAIGKEWQKRRTNDKGSEDSPETHQSIGDERIVEVTLAHPTPELLLMLREEVDFAVCLGGDGTLLFFNSFFPTSVPPVICVNYTGSLGFLTRFRMEDVHENIDKIIAGEMEILNRTRMKATVRVTRAHAEGAVGEDQEEEEEQAEELVTGQPAVEIVDGISYTFINEVVIDRGPSPFISSLECFCDGTHITTVQGDGIIIATSTGSTAYSLAAGGSMLHPLLSAVIFTPICPHSLSFRPVVLPGTAKLCIQVPSDSRSSAWVRFDGKQRFQLRREDSVAIEMAEFPLPMICKSDMTSEWFSALANCLSWNIRERQGKL